MRWWEILAARRERGNDEQVKATWSATRLLAFVIQKTAGNNKISKPSDLFSLPWDEDGGEEYTEEDIDRLEELMRQEDEKESN